MKHTYLICLKHVFTYIEVFYFKFLKNCINVCDNFFDISQFRISNVSFVTFLSYHV